MPKKYQVFVSSTFRDLVEERQDAIRNILDLNHIPAGMELFPAADIEQLTYIKKVIDECDYYILIMGGRYGSLDEGGVSYTEREYDYAVETGKVVLAFVHENPSLIPLGKSDIKAEVAEALKKFREKVMTGRLVKGWTSRQNLEPLVLKALIHVFNDRPQIGWIRGDAAATEGMLEQSNRLLQENSEIKALLSKAQSQLSGAAVIPDLADLDDRSTIRFKTRWYDRGSARYTDRDISLSWREIFISVAAQLDVSRTDVIVLSALKEAVKESGSELVPVEIDDRDRIKIKIQLEALGLVEISVSKTVAGGVAEFLKLTPKGRKIMVQELVARKTS